MSNTTGDSSRPSAFEALVMYKKEIEERWAQSARKNIGPATHLEEPILYDYFPALIQLISESLDPSIDRADAVEGNTLAQEHGGERVRLTNYNISQVALEYRLLKEAIQSVLEEKSDLTKKDQKTIDVSIDLALHESIAAYALAESYIREQFIAMLAHDIRGPVAFIKTAASILMDDPEPEFAMELFKRISHSAESAGQLIDSILDANAITTNRRIQLDIEETDIHELADKAAQNFQANIEIRGPHLVGHWCPRSLSRCIRNLLENALKYGDRNQPILIDISEDHGNLKVSVHNHGDPIPIDRQESIFQPFNRVQGTETRQIKGWGFGLPIVRGVVEGHGGSISVDSAEGRGTTFIFMIPIDSRPYQNAPTL